jgi:hypothetical protein
LGLPQSEEVSKAHNHKCPIFFSEVILAHFPTPKLQDSPLSAVATVYSIHSQLSSYLLTASSTSNMRICLAVVTSVRSKWSWYLNQQNETCVLIGRHRYISGKIKVFHTR